MNIESVQTQDRDVLLAIAVDTGLFTAEEADHLLGGVLDGLSSGQWPDGHQAVACRLQPGGQLVGWAYFAPDQNAAGVWNLWWIGVLPVSHGHGVGKRLLHHVERVVAAEGGRVLIVETSDATPLAKTRRFYEAQGYRECGRVPDFYADGEAKVVFARRPRGS